MTKNLLSESNNYDWSRASVYLFILSETATIWEEGKVT